MTKFIIFLIFTILFIVFVAIGRNKTGSDWLSPFCFVNAFFYLARIPRLLFAEENLYQKGEITDSMLWNYFFVTVCFFVIMNLTLLLLIPNKKNGPTKKSNVDSGFFFRIGLFFFFIGACFRLYEIVASGGFVYVIQNAWNRVELLEGMGYLDYFATFMTIGACFLEVACLTKKRKVYLLAFIVCLLSASVLNLAFGARSGLMKMLFGVVFVFYYCSPKRVSLRDFLKVRFILPALLVVVVLVYLPTIRRQDFDVSQLSFDSVISKLFSGEASIINEISVFDEDVFTIDYFSYHPHWYGGNYLNLFTAWIPRSFFPEKGIIDDGMFLRALMKGFNDINPNMTLSELHALGVSSSVPFTTSGIFYANFGFFGTVAGAFLTGLITSFCYKKAMQTRSITDVLFYQFICTRLCLSTKGIVELIMTFLVIKIIAEFIVRSAKPLVKQYERTEQKAFS